MKQNRFPGFTVLLVLVTAQIIIAQVPVNYTRLSSPRKAVASVSVGDQVWFVGGYEYHDDVPSNKIDVLDAFNQTWLPSPSLPEPRGFVTPVKIHPNLYFLGGM